jgi:hypothetical protein
LLLVFLFYTAAAAFANSPPISMIPPSSCPFVFAPLAVVVDAVLSVAGCACGENGALAIVPSGLSLIWQCRI